MTTAPGSPLSHSGVAGCGGSSAPDASTIQTRGQKMNERLFADYAHAILQDEDDREVQPLKEPREPDELDDDDLEEEDEDELDEDEFDEANREAAEQDEEDDDLEDEEEEDEDTPIEEPDKPYPNS